MNIQSDLDLDNNEDVDILNEPFLLPSQRKKQSNNQTNNGKSKKRPPKQKKVSLDQNLFDDFMLDDAFQIDSDEISPQNSDKSQPNSENENESNYKKSDDPITNLESSITRYINKSISLLKQYFIDEFKDMLDKSEDEESIINTFIYNLSSEIEEVAFDEIKLAQEEYKTKENLIDDTIKTFFSSFELGIPSSDLPKVSIDKMCEDVFISKSSLNENFMTPLRELHNESKLLSLTAAQNDALQQQFRIQSPSMMQALEIETDMKRIDIEEEFFNYKKKTFEQRKNDWQEAQTDPNRAMTDGEEIYSKLSTVARKIPQSKFNSAVFDLKTLIENVQSTLNDIMKERSKFEAELTYLVSSMKYTDTKMLPKNEFAADVKKQLRSYQKKRALHEHDFKYD